MTVAANPTEDSIVKEGIRKAVGRVATQPEVDRAKSEWLQEIFNDMWMLSEGHHLMEKTAFILLIEGIQRYNFPSDMYESITLSVADGTVRSTARGGTTTTITLAADDAAPRDSRVGREIITLTGTGASQRGTITDFDTSTKVATVDATWVAPSTSTTYIIPTDYIDLDPEGYDRFNSRLNKTFRDRPKVYTSHASQFVTWPVADKVYPMFCQYWLDFQQVDNGSAVYVKMLRLYRSLLVQGIFVKALNARNDRRYQLEYKIYNGMLETVAAKTGQSGHIIPAI